VSQLITITVNQEEGHAMTMTIMERPVIEATPLGFDVDDGFDLDIRISVGADTELPQAGFSCSWYSCRGTCQAGSPCNTLCTGSPMTMC